MKLYVFYFDRDGSGKYVPQLHRIRLQLEAAGCREPLVILTDPSSAVPAGWEVERWDPLKWLGKYHRTGVEGAQWDYKACLVMAKLETVQEGPGVYLDADNIIHADPVPALASLDPDGFYIGPDGAGRTIKHPAFSGTKLEHSTSIMVMPADSRALCEKYRELWDASTEPRHYLLEQRTWSLVCHAAGGRVLPRSLAYSTLWGKQVPEDTIIEHPHGPRKWVGV